MLNGASSAGKSSLAAALQAHLAERGSCWAVLGIDTLLGALPARWVTVDPDGFVFEGGRVELGPTARAALGAYRAMVAAVAGAGLDVLVDEVVLEPDGFDRWTEALAGLDVRWVRVGCDVDELERRERARGDRMPGLARWQHGFVHEGIPYDAVVDTTDVPAPAGATAIATALEL